MQSTCIICHYTMKNSIMSLECCRFSWDVSELAVWSWFFAWNNIVYDIHGDWIYWTESTQRYELICISSFTKNYDFRFKGNYYKLELFHFFVHLHVLRKEKNQDQTASSETSQLNRQHSNDITIYSVTMDIVNNVISGVENVLVQDSKNSALQPEKRFYLK
jgi:hypothetical protein